ncbi:hypothetical protein PVK06_003531 [Gossypium arboreum]|uniref:Uncharacterized protein n=1 Tax=Gossypium arboreum TaxID=29729 RepID=A0ABR0R6M5_GOSAR|nr:hypothetical protein PVK06_003531 [Gossypium arboreum]
MSLEFHWYAWRRGSRLFLLVAQSLQHASQLPGFSLEVAGGDDEEKKQESDTLPSFQRLGIGLPDLKCKKKGKQKVFKGISYCRSS